jgi:hypothetical protein
VSGLHGSETVRGETPIAPHYQGHRLAQYASLLIAGHADAAAAGAMILDPHSPPDHSPFALSGRAFAGLVRRSEVVHRVIN